MSEPGADAGEVVEMLDEPPDAFDEHMPPVPVDSDLEHPPGPNEEPGSAGTPEVRRTRPGRRNRSVPSQSHRDSVVPLRPCIHLLQMKTSPNIAGRLTDKRSVHCSTHMQLAAILLVDDGAWISRRLRFSQSGIARRSACMPLSFPQTLSCPPVGTMTPRATSLSW